MIIQGPSLQPQSFSRSVGSPQPSPSQPTDQLERAPQASGMTAIERLREYARKPLETPQLAISVPLGTTPPPAGRLASLEAVQDVLAGAATNVPEKVRSGAAAARADEYLRRQITKFQERKAEVEGAQISRLVHRQQLHGGAAEIHWNPAMNQLLQLFDRDSSQGLVRISDAAGGANPDGKTMYGFALELYGRENQPTNILLTGGTPRTEVSQAKSPEAQLALFNMLNPSSKVAGLGRILWDVGPIDGPKMLLDVARMRTQAESLADLQAWSRAPFALPGKDGKEYLVKMRVTPSQAPPPGEGSGETSSQKLASEFQDRLAKGEARWTLDFQFMQPGENAEDPRQAWKGPWLPAAEIVLPRVEDQAQAEKLAQEAEAVVFNPWKGKEPQSQSPDRDILRPWGELNRARLAAYQASANNRQK